MKTSSTAVAPTRPPIGGASGFENFGQTSPDAGSNKTRVIVDPRLAKPGKSSRTPPVGNYREIPVSVFNAWETAELVRWALESMELGSNFQSAAYLFDAMWRDDRISGVFTTRRMGILGMPLDFVHEDEEDDTPKLAAQREKVKKTFKTDWTSMVSSADLCQLFQWGRGLGLGLGELIWGTDETSGRWLPKVRVWHNSFVYWRWDTGVNGSYWLITAEGPVEVPESGLDPLGRPKWILYCPYGYYRGWMQGYVRSLAIPWLIKSWTRRDWARYSEVHGIPTRKAIVPREADAGVKAGFMAAISELGNEPVVECPQDAEGNKYDLQLVEAMSTNFQQFSQLLAHCDTSIAINLLGENLTTEVVAGSRAAAQVQDNVRIDYKRDDNITLGACIRQYLGRPWARFNFGNANLAPLPSWAVDPPVNVQALGAGWFQVAQAVATFKPVTNAVDVEKLLDLAKIPVLAEEDREPLPVPPVPGATEPPAPGGKAPAVSSKTPAPVKPGAAQAKAGPGKPAPKKLAQDEADVELSRLGRPTLDRPRKPKILTEVSIIDARSPDGKKMLWGKQNASGKWTTPGGHLEEGEFPEQAAFRELHEEAGVVGHDPLYMGTGRGGENGEVAVHVYRITCEGAPHGKNDPDNEVNEWGWYDPDHLPDEILNNLAVQDNILLKMLGVQKGPIKQLRQDLYNPGSAGVAQRYIDGLVESSTVAGAHALSPILEKVYNCVMTSGSSEALYKALEHTFEHLDPKDFAQRVAEARVLADVAGRGDVFKEVAR